jgi:alkylhydroperoxidase/carboxymuconolactone decarboxylase family protein YurZ
LAGVSTALAVQLNAATNSLPASAALPLGSSTTRGFAVRSLQGPAEPALGNNILRALRQLNGTLVDTNGVAVPNQAFPPDSGSVWAKDGINYEREAAQVDVSDVDGNVIASFLPEFFPGIPGSGGHTDNFVVEAVTFLELAPGTYTFGVNAGADRTDVNNDDGFQVLTALNPRDFFATKLGEFERNVATKPFSGNQRNESTFTLVVSQAGLYPVRLVYWQTGLGANLQLYTITPDTGERILVNDANDARAVKAYRNNSTAGTSGPYVGEVSPAGGSDGNSASAPIEAVIVDGSATVATSAVKLYLNGTAVVPQKVAKNGGVITLAYSPNATRQDKNNLVRLEYTDSTGVSRTNSWSFGIITSGGSSTTVAGQWDFEAGNLSATVGQALAYFTPAAQAGTKFGTTGAGDFADVPNIGGTAAKVMEVPGDLTRDIGYVVTHDIAPNGGGTRVNQYTLIMDVLVDTSGPGAASLWQTSSAANTDDGDLFWQGNNFGQGGGGYNGRGTFTAGAWHRVVAAYDMAANPPVVTKYVDGIKQDDWTANQSLDNPRRSLAATAILFADGDQDERRKMWVNSVQIRSGKISDAEAFALGGPTAAGIQQSIPQSNVTGMWDFNFGDLGASIGAPLAYFDGAEGLTKTGTVFGTTGDENLVEVPGINGQPAKVMKVPGDLDRNIGYVMTHRIAPNGGGARVNQYTLVMDVYVETSGPGAASLWQTSSAANTDDGDLFWQGNNFGQGGGGYNGRGSFTAGAWHRVVAAYDMAATPPVVVKYVDGIKQDEWTANQSLDNPRRSLATTAILFADGDQDERRVMYVNAVQIRSGRLSDTQIVALGGPSADGIPVVLPNSTVKGQWDFEFGDLGATIGAPLTYFDGPAGLTKAGTVFGVTGEGDFADVPKIDGQAAKVMKVPGDLDRNIGYLMTHRIAPNGGGTKVNQYTIVFDILVDTSGPGAASLIQISSKANTDDGDLFWQGSNFGQGGGGYNGTGAFTAGEWHRVAAAYNMAANPPVVTKYVDGIFQDDWTANQSLDNPRRALQDAAILFGDGDQDERRVMYVSSVQIREGALSKPELESLGKPTAGGIPVFLSVAPPVVSGPTVTTTVPAGLSGSPLTNATVNTATKTITADIPAGGSQGYLTITPAVVITSSKIENGKLVITYQ